MKKVSVTLEDDVVAGVRSSVTGREFSAYVNAAVKRSLQADRLRELLEEFELTDGPIPPEVQAEVDSQIWPR